MAKRKLPPDNLDLDCIRAMRLGYGCHYGQYKADYPRTREMNEREADNLLRQPEPVAVLDPESDIPPSQQRRCPYCGRVFRRKGKKIYCDSVCQIRFNNQLKRGKKNAI